MSFTRPYVTRHFVDVEQGDSHHHGLSIAIRPVDQFTEERALAHLRLKLKELPTARQIRSLSGLVCFEDLEPREYTLLVQSDPEIVDPFFVKPLKEPWIDTLEIPIKVEENVILSFDLQLAPRPSYPFPPNATLVRGTVTTQDFKVVADAVVRATYFEVNPAGNPQNISRTVESLTNRDGEYVAFFKRLPRPKQGETLTAKLVAVKGDIPSLPETVVIKEGTTQKANPLVLPL